jgi:HAD superfamily hydrolase (TIGR01549 family)
MTGFQKNGIYNDSILESLPQYDGIVFDCDGVLIDITKSYDLTIIKTTQYILNNFAAIDDGIPIDSEIIDGFKSTGGFNDEVDLTYAAILSIISAKKIGKDQRNFIFEVIKNSDSSGIKSVESYLEKISDISQIKKILSYPGPHSTNPLYKIFDQIFYGPELYKKIYGVNSQFFEPGLIENDLVIFNDTLAKKLQTRFSSNIAIVTGRGKESVKFSLGALFDKFNLTWSVFLEDEPRKMAKPNPESLIRTITGMKCKNIIYVGDSMEDLIMAKKATQMGHNTTFCGIIGTSKNPERKLQLFEQNGAHLILDSINLIPNVLNLE